MKSTNPEFKFGDIVEVNLPENNLRVRRYNLDIEWNGLQIKLTEKTTGFFGHSWKGQVIKSVNDDRLSKVGMTITWGGIENGLHLKLVEPQQDKYLSPFSGKWV